MSIRPTIAAGRFGLGACVLVAISVVATAQEKKKDPPASKDKDKPPKAAAGPEFEDAAVADGLVWLARQQQKDGSWKFDGASKETVAATGLALLPFLAAGEGPTKAKKYRDVVKKGTDWLATNVRRDGRLTDFMYAHAIGTIALCDAYQMAKTDKLKQSATAAVGFIVSAQGKNGSWGYSARTDGDTSIVGWQIQALKSAEMAGIKFEKDKVYKPANKFLESVSDNGGSTYGYREKGNSPTLTPVGLLSRYQTGDMTVRDDAFSKGVDFVKKSPPQKGTFDIYYLYYATRVLYSYGGPDWEKFWNPKVRDVLIEMQDKDGDDTKKGSWAKDQAQIGSQCGRLGTTSLCLLTLQVEQRYPALKKDGAKKEPKK
jgi:hypothetical protein